VADFNTAAAEVRSHFSTQWALSHTEPIADDNDPAYKPPTDGFGIPSTWLRHLIEPADYDQISMGADTGGSYKDEFTSIIQFFIPLGSSIPAAETLVSDAQIIMRGKTLANVILGSPLPVRVGVIEDDNWFQFNLETLATNFTSV
jgi:hypothetical protein